MTTHTTATREQWLAARLELLEAEKELTRRSDEVARRRQELPWVPVEKDYRFETADGPASLADLFGGRSQLLVYHFMFGPDYTGGCPSCSAIADGFNGSVVHLEHHDVALLAVSRAPVDKPRGLQAAHGLDVPVGVVAGQRLQLRLQHLDHRGRSSGPGASTTTSAPRTRRGSRTSTPPARSRSSRRWPAPTPPAFVRERAGHERVRHSRTASCTTPTPPTRAASTGCGACTSGSTARPWDATRAAPGGGGATSTETADPLPSGVPWPPERTSATSRSSPTSTTARRRWSTRCCGSPAPSAPTRTSPSG